MEPTPVLATVTGRNRPGIAASFFASLAAHDVEVRHVAQVVIRDRLILAILLDLRGEVAPLRESVFRTARALGMEAEVLRAGDAPLPREQGGSRFHVIVIGRPLRPGAISMITQRIADLEGSVETIAQLSVEPTSSIELVVTVPDAITLRDALARAAEETGVDIAVEPFRLRRRPKRLVVLDADSTVLREQPLDVLTKLAAGQLTDGGVEDDGQSLRARIARLRGLPIADVQAACDRIGIKPGIADLVTSLRSLGYQIALVSVGFSLVTDRLISQHGLAGAAANVLEVEAGVLTGRLIAPIIDRSDKAQALRRCAANFGVPLSQSVAVGHGSEDLDMLGSAGLGIAVNGKSPSHLDSVLFVLGITGHEVIESDNATGVALSRPS